MSGTCARKIQRARTSLIPFLFCLQLACIAAQGNSPEEGMELKDEKLVPRRVFVTASAPDDYATQVKTAAEFLVIELIAQSSSIPTAVEADANVILELRLSVTDGKISLQATATDKISGLAVFSRQYKGASLASKDVSPFLSDLAKAFNANFPPVPQRIVEVTKERVVEETETVTTERGAWLTIKAPAGTLLAIPGKRAAKVNETGEYKLEVIQNTTVRYRATLSGRMPAERVVFVENSDLSDEVSLAALKKFELGFSLHYLNMVPAFSAAWFVKPGTFYVSFAIESSFLAVIRNFNGGSASSPVPALYYLEDRLGFGARLGQADAKLRPALNLELVNRFEFAKEYFALAYWSPVGLAAGWELLLRLSPGFYLQFGSSGRAQLLRSEYWTGPLPGEGAGKPLLASTPVGFMLGRNLFLSAADFAFGIRMEL